MNDFLSVNFCINLETIFLRWKNIIYRNFSIFNIYNYIYLYFLIYTFFTFDYTKIRFIPTKRFSLIRNCSFLNHAITSYCIYSLIAPIIYQARKYRDEISEIPRGNFSFSLSGVRAHADTPIRPMGVVCLSRSNVVSPSEYQNASEVSTERI